MKVNIVSFAVSYSITNADESIALTVQLDARAIPGCCEPETPSPPPSSPPSSHPVEPVTVQPGLTAPLDPAPDTPAPKAPAPKAPATEDPPAEDPTTDNPTTSGPSTSAPVGGLNQPKLSQTDAEAKGQKLLTSKTPSKTFPSYTKNYKLGSDNVYSLSANSRTFLSTPLKENPTAADAKFTQFEVFSQKVPVIKGKKPKIQLPTLRAGYSADGISVEFMDKEMWDGNLKPNKIPTSELLVQGAAQTNSKPTYVYMKKIANSDTTGFIQSALKEKYPDSPASGATGDWTLESTSTDPTEQKWFNTLIVCPHIFLVFN